MLAVMSFLPPVRFFALHIYWIYLFFSFLLIWHMRAKSRISRANLRPPWGKYSIVDVVEGGGVSKMGYRNDSGSVVIFGTCSGVTCGSVNTILAPPCCVFSARMVPPCASMMARTIVRPRPLPPVETWREASAR